MTGNPLQEQKGAIPVTISTTRPDRVAPDKAGFPTPAFGPLILWVPVGGTLLPEQNVERITNLIISYFRAVDHVHKNHKLPKQEKLERLLDPLIELNKLLAPLHFVKENPYRRYDDTYPFISERVYKDDLDFDHLEYDKNKYSIDWCENERIPERRGPRIWKYETEEETRLREQIRSEEEARRGIKLEDSLIIHSYPSNLYQKWLPSLDEEKIQSRDLLDQILVCYTIKRAINGDKKAIEKLYGLYEYAAGALGAKFARQNRLPVDELKDTAKDLLRYIIEGFSPEIIIKDLLTDQKETIPHLPGWVKDFFIYYLSEYLPPKIQEVLTEVKLVKESEQRERFLFLYFKLLALLDPYTPIRDFTLWEKSQKRIRKFNTYCFRPGLIKMGPHHNLSTWIFSSRFGKLYQLLMDKYESRIFIRKGGKRIRIKNMSDDFQDCFIEKSQSELTIKEKKKIISDRKRPFKRSPGEIIRELKKYGISKRDAEIFTEWRFPQQPITQDEIAKKFNLSRRQIIRICKKIKQIFNTSS